MKKNRMSKVRLYENLQMLLMVLPGVVLVFIFSYMPLPGIALAFKKFNQHKVILQFLIRYFYASFLKSQKIQDDLNIAMMNWNRLQTALSKHGDLSPFCYKFLISCSKHKCHSPTSLTLTFASTIPGSVPT